MVFCNQSIGKEDKKTYNVTILILVDGFLQYKVKKVIYKGRGTSQSLF